MVQQQNARLTNKAKKICKRMLFYYIAEHGLFSWLGQDLKTLKFGAVNTDPRSHFNNVRSKIKLQLWF